MITCVILTKNEEENIIDAIKSVLWCDEILIVDDKSEDETRKEVENLRNSNIRFLSHDLISFSEQRNFALEKAKNEWVLFLDADERVSERLAFEIQNIRHDGVVGYAIPRRDVFNGRKLRYGETGSMVLVRFGSKKYGKWEGVVHEEWKLKGSLGKFKGEIIHYSHESVFEFLSSVNKYSTLRAEELFQKKTKTNLMEIIIYPSGKFVLNYFIKLGFLDGVEGFIYASMMSLHSFLVRGKLFLLQNEKFS